MPKTTTIATNTIETTTPLFIEVLANTIKIKLENVETAKLALISAKDAKQEKNVIEELSRVLNMEKDRLKSTQVLRNSYIMGELQDSTELFLKSTNDNALGQYCDFSFTLAVKQLVFDTDITLQSYVDDIAIITKNIEIIREVIKSIEESELYEHYQSEYLAKIARTGNYKNAGSITDDKPQKKVLEQFFCKNKKVFSETETILLGYGDVSQFGHIVTNGVNSSKKSTIKLTGFNSFCTALQGLAAARIAKINMSIKNGKKVVVELDNNGAEVRTETEVASEVSAEVETKTEVASEIEAVTEVESISNTNSN